MLSSRRKCHEVLPTTHNLEEDMVYPELQAHALFVQAALVTQSSWLLVQSSPEPELVFE